MSPTLCDNRFGTHSESTAAMAGSQITAQIAGATVKASHPVIAEPKQQLNLIVFDGEAGFRNLRIVK